MAARRITAETTARITELVGTIEGFLPLSARSPGAITFETLFKESRVAGYLPRKGTKRQQLQAAWEQIFRRHPRFPHALIRKIVPAAIQYRTYKRRPLTRPELDRLAECLASLGVNLTRELAKVPLDESLPLVRVPPPELVRSLREHPLAEELAREPLSLFENGHYNEAVRKGAEKFEALVQSLTGRAEIGKELMGKAFNPGNPAIRLNALATENERGIQEGYMLLSMGMMRAIRNVFSHGDEEQRSPEECYEMLLFLNWLFRQLRQIPSA